MQVDGKEFLRNVNIEKEKAKLEKQKRNLDESKVNAVKKEPDYFEPEDDAAYLDVPMDEKENTPLSDNLNHLHDIRLEGSNNDDNKKKYIILGFALILLFIITIVIVRLISNSQEEEKIEKSKPAVQEQKVEKIKEDEKLNKIETPKEYKKVIQEDDFKKPAAPIAQKVEKKDIILPEPVKEESPVIIEPKKPAVKPKDLFGIDPVKETIVKEEKKVKPKVEKQAVKKVEKKVEKQVEKKVAKPKVVIEDKPKRKMVVNPPKETNFVKKTQGNVKGYYIQIGSFSKKPSDRYLSNIKNKGYSYAVHGMNIKGKYYNKVLIGPYPTRATAKSSLAKVRKAFKVPGAYILKF